MSIVIDGALTAEHLLSGILENIWTKNPLIAQKHKTGLKNIQKRGVLKDDLTCAINTGFWSLVVRSQLFL